VTYSNRDRWIHIRSLHGRIFSMFLKARNHSVSTWYYAQIGPKFHEKNAKSADLKI
jgi:hypothetical protein